MPNVGTASVDLEVDGSKFGRNVRSAVERESHGINSMFSGIGRSAGSAMSAGFSGAIRIVERLGTATGVAGVALGGFGLKVAADFQQTRIAFEGILGSAEKAQGFLDKLRDFAAKTPFEFPELATASKSLLAVGFNANDVIPIMTKLGNVAATLGVGGEAINGVVRALGQMKGKGKASAEELNQISEQIPGFSAVEAIAKKLGITTAEAFKKMETGAISADVAIEAILEGMEKFPGAAGAMERQSKTLNGVISTLKDTFRDALIDGIEPFLPSISSGLVKLQPVLKSAVTGIIGVLKDGVVGVKAFFAAFSGEGVTSDGFVGFMERLGVGARVLVDRFKEAWPKIREAFESGLNAIKGAIDLAVPVIEVFANVGADLIRNLPTLSGALDGLAGAFRAVGGFVADHIEGFSQLAEIIGVIMVARLVALKVQLAITFGASVIQSIIAFGTATVAAETATTGLSVAAGAAGISLGGVFVAAAALTGGLAILWRTTIDNNDAAEKWTIRGIELARQIPIIGDAVAGLTQQIAGITDAQIDAERSTQSLTARLVDYARGYRATVTIDTSQARQGIQNLRDDLALLNSQIAESGPGGGRGAARNSVEGQLAAEEAAESGTFVPGPSTDAESLPDRAHGMDEGPIPGRLGEPVIARVHAGEWVLTPDQFESLTSGRSGGSSSPGTGVDSALLRLTAVLEALEARGIRAEVTTSAVARGLHNSRRP